MIVRIDCDRRHVADDPIVRKWRWPILIDFEDRITWRCLRLERRPRGEVTASRGQQHDAHARANPSLVLRRHSFHCHLESFRDHVRRLHAHYSDGDWTWSN